ncbi:MAG: hypothetical protein ACRD2W_12120 [Acidimicrobiales bacterium]
MLVPDEPTNGLDSAGVRWLRDLLRAEIRRGRTVLVSSHLLAEVSQTVDHVVIVDRGRLVTARSMADVQAAGQSLEDAFPQLTSPEEASR